MLSTLLVALAGTAQLPQGVPHPTHPLPASSSEGLTESFSGLVSSSRWTAWQALAPSWLERGPAAQDDAARRAALEELARRRGGDPSLVRSWTRATRPRSVALEVRVIGPEGEALLARQPVREGHPTLVGAVRARRFLMDFDVEIASGSQIADPVNGFLFGGRSLAVELLPVPGRGWRAELAFVDSRARDGAWVDLGYDQLSGKPRLRQALTECGTTALMVPGEPVRLRVPAHDGTPVVVELTARGGMPAAPRTLAPDLHWLWLPTAAAEAGAWGRFLKRWADDAAVMPVHPGVVVMEGEGAAARAATAVRESAAAVEARAVRVRVVVEVPGSEARLTEFAVPCVAGRPVALAHGRLVDALVDWDVEVAMVARVADPYFERLFSGVAGSVRVDPLGDGVSAVRMDLRVTEAAPGEARVIRVSAGSAGEMGFEGNVPPSPPQQMHVEPAEVAELRLHGDFETDAEGRLTIERGASEVYGEGARLTVTVDVQRGG